MSELLLPLDPQLYRETLAQVQLQGVHLHSLHSECQNRLAGEIKINISVEAEPNIEEGELNIKAYYKFVARNPQGPLFTIEPTFHIILGVPDELPEGFVAVYIANNLNLTVFPYVRELVSSLTARMGLPPLTLPYTPNPFQETPIRKAEPRKSRSAKSPKEADAQPTSRRKKNPQ